MLRKVFFSLIGFGLGLFMLLNSAAVFNKLIKGEPWSISPQEKLFSAIITCVVGLVLIIWTYLLVKRYGSRNTL